MLCLVLLQPQIIEAQPPLFNCCSSAGSLINPVQFNCDFSGQIGNGIDLHYKGQSDGNFALIPMSPANESPFYDFTYKTSVNFTNSPGILEYYFSTTQDTLIATQSPKNANNQFPPTAYKYANFISDPQGDMVGGSDGNWLDLTSSGMTYSDTRLYCYLRNVSGTWPQSQLFTYYVYTMGFLITSGPDTAYYAFVYANVPLLISSGLYILNRTDSSYTRLGNISSTINGGALHMACDLSVFISDPAWPGWPPPDGYIIPMGATLTASLSNQFVNDITYPAEYEPQTEYLNFGINNSPILSSYRIEVDSGVSLNPKIIYSDQDNNLPAIRIFHFDTGSYLFSSFDHHYSDSSEFQTTLAWPGDGWHRYYCEFSDGNNTVETALDSLRIGVPVCDYLVGDINGVGGVNGIDVVYGVSYLKGGNPPPYTCECTPGNSWYVAGDANASCNFNGVDVTYLVSYFKGGPVPRPCPDCPPRASLAP
jgi:hypothetical protein